MSEIINPYAPPIPDGDPLEDAFPTGDVEELRGTEMGLRTMYYGIVLLLLCTIANVLLSLFLDFADFTLFAYVFGLATLAACFMFLLGPMFCLTVSVKTGAKRWIVSSVCCQWVGIVGSLAWFLSPLRSDEVIPLLGVASTLVGNLLFVVFVMRIAKFIERDDLWASGLRLVVVSVLWVVLLLSAIVATTVMDWLGWVSLTLSLSAMLGVMILFMMYANLLHRMYLAISRVRRPGMPKF